jgi:adenylate cyclase
VNLASRLEGQTAGYGVSIILGQSTAVAVQERYAVVEIDLLRVKGKKEPERIFALFGVQGIPELDVSVFNRCVY